MNNKVAIFSEEYVNDKTDDTSQGITIVVYGKLKEVFDLIIKKESKYQNYIEIVRDALFDGISFIINQGKFFD